MTPKPNCARSSRDTAGGRCGLCDPIVQTTIYGLPRDGFRRVVDRVVVEGVFTRVERSIVPWPAAAGVAAVSP